MKEMMKVMIMKIITKTIIITKNNSKNHRVDKIITA